MKKDIGMACAGIAMLAAMLWAPDAHAQQTSWWDQQKAKAAQAAAEANGQEAAAQGETKATQPAVQPEPAVVPVAVQEKIEGSSYTYLEAGIGRVNVAMYGIDENGGGGYVRGSMAAADGLYVFAGHDRAEKSWNTANERLKIAIDQTEIGFGANLALSPRTDFISELSWLRLGGEVDYKDQSYPQNDLRGSDHLNAGKLMLGLRARPASSLELWAKAGYLRLDDNLLLENSAVGNVGFQYRFTPRWGVVGEAEFYEDVRFYRLGVRASF